MLGLLCCMKLEFKLQQTFTKTCPHCGAENSLSGYLKAVGSNCAVIIPLCCNCRKPIWDNLNSAKRYVKKAMKAMNTKKANNLRKKAESMQKQINAKRHPASAYQNPTARRANIIAGMAREADRLEKTQAILNAMADAVENDTLPRSLRNVNSKVAIETVLSWSKIPDLAGWTKKDRDRLNKAGIITNDQLREARQDLESLAKSVTKSITSLAEERKQAQQRMELQLRKEPGFFVTPTAIVEMMIDRAEITVSDSILEPSAGLGDIADQLPKEQTKVIEYNTTRNKFLQDAGHNVIGYDFLEHSGEYDKILMNPPFERLQDIVHVKHAYSLLKPGGKVIAIMSESPFFRTDRKATDFRKWLDSVGGVSEKLPAGAFKTSGTGVSVRIVEITKVSEVPATKSVA